MPDKHVSTIDALHRIILIVGEYPPTKEDMLEKGISERLIQDIQETMDYHKENEDWCNSYR